MWKDCRVIQGKNPCQASFFRGCLFGSGRCSSGRLVRKCFVLVMTVTTIISNTITITTLATTTPIITIIIIIIIISSSSSYPHRRRETLPKASGTSTPKSFCRLGALESSRGASTCRRVCFLESWTSTLQRVEHEGNAEESQQDQRN